MFTGIIEAIGTISRIEKKGSNIAIEVKVDFSGQLKAGQSVNHNGICMTVMDIYSNTYLVAAVKETVERSNARNWKAGDRLNLERAMPANGRFEGHIVQGHVDATAKCKHIETYENNKELTFELEKPNKGLLVEKGSIAVDGVSLTAFTVSDKAFTVTIIPHTLEHTIIGKVVVDYEANIEFDVLGKYMSGKIRN